MPKKRKERIKKIKIKAIIEKYSFELLIILLICLGIFLLLEDYELKKFIKKFSIYIYINMKYFIYYMYNSIFEFILKIEFSNIIGLLFILSAVTLIFLRWRNNLIYNYSSSGFCHNCKSKLQRIKRRTRVKVFAFFIRLKIKKYQCKNCKLHSYKITSL